jgi:hypothetical protein
MGMHWGHLRMPGDRPAFSKAPRIRALKSTRAFFAPADHGSSDQPPKNKRNPMTPRTFSFKWKISKRDSARQEFTVAAVRAKKEMKIKPPKRNRTSERKYASEKYHPAERNHPSAAGFFSASPSSR